MSDEIKIRLSKLFGRINAELDRIHAEVLVLLLSQGRATGQRTRLDRL